MTNEDKYFEIKEPKEDIKQTPEKKPLMFRLGHAIMYGVISFFLGLGKGMWDATDSKKDKPKETKK